MVEVFVEMYICHYYAKQLWYCDAIIHPLWTISYRSNRWFFSLLSWIRDKKVPTLRCSPGSGTKKFQLLHCCHQYPCWTCHSVVDNSKLVLLLVILFKWLKAVWHFSSQHSSFLVMFANPGTYFYNKYRDEAKKDTFYSRGLTTSKLLPHSAD